MNINKINYSESLTFKHTGKLIPIDKYKGPILKLTELDKEKITQYQDSITSLELNISKFQDFLRKRHNANNASYYYDKISRCEYEIDRLKKLIRDIKINRIKIQKEQLL